MFDLLENTPGKIKKNTLTTNSGRFADLDPNKLRGGYYTPTSLTEWLCQWAIKHANDQVLEPSCGDGSFLCAAANRLMNLGAKPIEIVKQLVGIEIVPAEARKASENIVSLLGKVGNKVVQNGDFFGEWMKIVPSRNFDCVIGNPPFIRYQSFPEPFRDLAMKIMSDCGLKPNRLTNIWVPFVVAAIASLRVDGCMALILPAELLQVTYAAQLRTFLADRFKRIDIVACNHLFFEKAQQEVVLLLADGAIDIGKTKKNNTCRVTLTETNSLDEMIKKSPNVLLKNAEPKEVEHGSEKWLKYFLSSQEIALMRELKSSKKITTLSFHAEVDVGVVTGKNEFFVLDENSCDEFGIRKEYRTPLAGRASHLKGAILNKSDWNHLANKGERVHLLDLRAYIGKKLPTKILSYIKSGEVQGFHNGYKCSIRKPWYIVPSVWIPHGFIFRQIYDFPRIVLNNACATSTDTIHRLTCKSDPEKIIALLYSSLTAASAEIEGRSYGGGVLELEPTEAERLLMPRKIISGLPLDECDKLIRSGRLEDLLNENDHLILQNALGLSAKDCKILRSIWIKMRDRRRVRGFKGK